MSFQFSDRSKDLQIRISKFLDDHVYPAEEIYAKQMEEFTQSNPGLDSRFKTTLSFEDFSEADLIKIFKKMCTSQKIKIKKDALKVVEEKLSAKKEKLTHGFANAREVRKLFESSLEFQALRAIEDGVIEEDEIKNLTCSDLESVTL